MKTWLFALALATAAFAADPPAPPSAPSADAMVQQLSWLAGHWRGASDSGTYEAWYSTPEGGVILSQSKEYSGGKLIFWAFERFSVENGVVTVLPYVEGEPSVSFGLVELDPDEKRAVFENKRNKWPTRLTYYRVQDRLVISASGIENGKTRESKFDLTLQK